LKGKTDWDSLNRMTDEEIEKAVAEDPDAAPILDETFWKNAIVVRATKKLPMTVRLDEDVLLWFRAQGKGYQTRINAVLRSYMHAHGPLSRLAQPVKSRLKESGREHRCRRIRNA
jgi:uncharacterized protein (DUF4415 family)